MVWQKLLPRGLEQTYVCSKGISQVQSKDEWQTLLAAMYTTNHQMFVKLYQGHLYQGQVKSFISASRLTLKKQAIAWYMFLTFIKVLYSVLYLMEAAAFMA